MKYIIGKQEFNVCFGNRSGCTREVWNSGTDKLTLADSLKSDQI